MWGFVDCTRYFLSVGVPKVVLHHASMVADSSERVGLLIPPGQGKSTIIRLLAGVEKPKGAGRSATAARSRASSPASRMCATSR